MNIVDELIKTCKDDNANVRRASAVALGEMNAKTAKNALAALLKDKEAVVKEAAIYALGDIGATEAADLLARLLTKPDGDVRKAIMEAVSTKKGEQEAVKPALPGGKDKPAGDNWKVKKAAALVLCKLKPELAVKPLMSMLDHDNNNLRIEIGRASCRERV